MNVKRSGLGRNLSALLSQPINKLESETPKNEIITLAIDSLQPGVYQPRTEIEDDPLNELAESIKKQGLLQPILVRERSDGMYEIIAGERRWRACQLAELQEIPVIVKQVDDETAMAMALVENLQREDLNAMDQARAMYRLTTEFALTHQQVAELLCKSRTAVSNFLRLLALSNPVKKLLEHGDIDMGHARALLALDELQQNQVAELVVAKSLSVRETEKLVDRIKNKRMHSNQSLHEDFNTTYKEHLDYLTRYLQTAIKLKSGKSGQGELIIHYENQYALEHILKRLKNN